MRKAFDPREYLGPEAISPNASGGNELFRHSGWRDFCRSRPPSFAKSVTADGPEKLGGATAEPFPPLLDDVLLLSTTSRASFEPLQVNYF